MNLEKIKDFRLGCSRETSLLHISKEELDQALETRKLEEVDGFYYAIMGNINTYPYVAKDTPPLRWNAGVPWALSTYQGN